MGLILLIVVLLLVFGGGGWGIYSGHPWGYPGIGIGGTVILIIMVVLVLSGRL